MVQVTRQEIEDYARAMVRADDAVDLANRGFGGAADGELQTIQETTRRKFWEILAQWSKQHAP